MTAMRSPMRIASSGSCVTMTEVARVSRSSDSVSSCIASRSCTSRPENGSSISITAGRGTMARASATRCCWPPERMCG